MHEDKQDKALTLFYESADPVSMASGAGLGAIIAGISAAFTSTLGWSNGYVMLSSALLFGVISTVANKQAEKKEGRYSGAFMLVLYCLAASAIMFWNAVQATTVLASTIKTVDAAEASHVFVDRAGNYVAVHPEHGEFRCPEWAANEYKKYFLKQQSQKKNPWSLKF